MKIHINICHQWVTHTHTQTLVINCYYLDSLFNFNAEAEVREIAANAATFPRLKCQRKKKNCWIQFSLLTLKCNMREQPKERNVCVCIVMGMQRWKEKVIIRIRSCLFSLNYNFIFLFFRSTSRHACSLVVTLLKSVNITFIAYINYAN
jgi:hypothetical protein